MYIGPEYNTISAWLTDALVIAFRRWVRKSWLVVSIVRILAADGEAGFKQPALSAIMWRLVGALAMFDIQSL